jgi:hypothetical protein
MYPAQLSTADSTNKHLTKRLEGHPVQDYHYRYQDARTPANRCIEIR